MSALGGTRTLPRCLIGRQRHTCAMNDHEAGLLTFLTSRSERRLRSLWDGGPKKIGAARDYLNQMEFDPRYEHPLSGATSLLDAIQKELGRRGAPPLCYVISWDAALDGAELPLDEALLAASGLFEATFLSCLPGKLGFFEGGSSHSPSSSANECPLRVGSGHCGIASHSLVWPHAHHRNHRRDCACHQIGSRAPSGGDAALTGHRGGSSSYYPQLTR